MGESARGAATAVAWPARASTHIYQVVLNSDSDALARLLVPFAALQVRLAGVEYRSGAHGALARIEAADLSIDRAHRLQARLAQFPCVRRVDLV